MSNGSFIKDGYGIKNDDRYYDNSWDRDSNNNGGGYYGTNSRISNNNNINGFNN